MRPRVPTLFALTATLLLVQSAAAQSAAEILRTALERHDARMADIDNYTVVQNVNGMSVPVYFEKRMEGGHAVFEPRVGTTGAPGAMPGSQHQMGTGEMLMRLGERARVAGTEEVEGRDAWVLEVDDASGLGMEARGFTPTSMTLLLDREDYVPLAMTVNGDMDVEGESHPVTMKTRFTDYRNVKGLLHPFRSSVAIEGMAAAVPTGDREQMQQLRKQLEQMSPEQRRAMEEQMKQMPQMRQMMEQMEAMAAGRDMEFTVEVQDIRVNEGPPSGA